MLNRASTLALQGWIRWAENQAVIGRSVVRSLGRSSRPVACGLLEFKRHRPSIKHVVGSSPGRKRSQRNRGNEGYREKWTATVLHETGRDGVGKERGLGIVDGNKAFAQGGAHRSACVTRLDGRPPGADDVPAGSNAHWRLGVPREENRQGVPSPSNVPDMAHALWFFALGTALYVFHGNITTSSY